MSRAHNFQILELRSEITFHLTPNDYEGRLEGRLEDVLPGRRMVATCNKEAIHLLEDSIWTSRRWAMPISRLRLEARVGFWSVWPCSSKQYDSTKEVSFFNASILVIRIFSSQNVGLWKGQNVKFRNYQQQVSDGESWIPSPTPHSQCQHR